MFYASCRDGPPTTMTQWLERGSHSSLVEEFKSPFIRTLFKLGYNISLSSVFTWPQTSLSSCFVCWYGQPRVLLWLAQKFKWIFYSINHDTNLLAKCKNIWRAPILKIPKQAEDLHDLNKGLCNRLISKLGFMEVHFPNKPFK